MTCIYADHPGRITVVGNFMFSQGGTAVNRAGIGEIILSSNNLVSATNVNVDDYYIKSSSATFTAPLTLNGTTNTITGARFTGDVLPTATQVTNLGADAYRYLNVYGIWFNGDSFQARTTGGAEFKSSNGVSGMKFSGNRNLIIQPDGGGIADINTAALQINTTTKGILLPRLTTAQRDAIASPAEGLEIYNLTTHTKNFYNGTIWKAVVTD